MANRETNMLRSANRDNVRQSEVGGKRRSQVQEQIGRNPSPMIVLPDQTYEDISGALDKVHIDSKRTSELEDCEPAQFHPLQYHHHGDSNDSVHPRADRGRSPPTASSSHDHKQPQEQLGLLSPPNSRPNSASSPASDQSSRGRHRSPGNASHLHIRNSSSQGNHSPDSRGYRHSPVDLQRLPYAQQTAPTMSFVQTNLQTAIGNNIALLSRKKTLEMYRHNVRRTNEPEVQYSFATFLVDTAQILVRDPDPPDDWAEDRGKTADELFTEARSILQRLSDRSHPFAQYYLADGLANGILNKGKEDDDRALPLFVAASKHGHAESAYRTALCYEHGWGTTKSPPRAAQYLKQAASKNHPGAMFRLAKACLTGDLGMDVRYREGIKWLKRAAESADAQYNGAPFELGVLHEAGYGDDVFKDEAYAAQLFTRSADLGHAEACFRLGDAYEHGKVSCPKDPSLSVHFYHMGAKGGHSGAMLAICAWYMVGAPPVLEKDEDEAYEWAKKAAEAGLSKAQYTTGYFTEMGIGCRRDPLEANVWYVRAADQGDARAKTRLAAIQAVYSGKPPPSSVFAPTELPSKSTTTDMTENAPSGKGKKRWGIF